MKSKGNQLDLYRSKIKATELNFDVMEDPDLADDLSQDCLKLFEMSEESFESIKGQLWYKRLWSTLSGGNTRKLSQGCSSLVQAQQLLLAVLQTHAQSCNRTNVLMTCIAGGLRKVEAQQSEVIICIIDMADRVDLLEKEMVIHREKLLFDPDDEYSWDPKDRLILFKILVFAAMADKKLVAEEAAYLDYKLEQLQLTGAYREEAEKFRTQWHDIDDLLNLDSYKMKLVLFRHALGMVYSDGKLTWRERGFIKRLGQMLKIDIKDQKTIRNEFSIFHFDIPPSQLDETISPSAFRASKEEMKKSFKEIDHQKELKKKAQKVWEETILKAKAELDETAPLWIETVSNIISGILVYPIFSRFEAYNGLGDDSEIGDLVSMWDGQALMSELNNNISFTFEAFDKYVSDIDDIVGLPRESWKALEETWKAVVSDDAGFESIYSRLILAGEQMIAEKPSLPGAFIKGAVVGAAAVALLGPFAIPLAMVGNYFHDESKANKFELAAKNWHNTLGELGDCTEKWRLNASNHIESYLQNLIGSIHTYQERSKTEEQLTAPIALMQTDIEEIKKMLEE